MGAGTLSPWAPRLTILGSGTIRCTAKRQPPGYLVGDPNSGPCILIDPGPGTLAALPRAGATPEGIDLVLVTHTHIDHHLDLAALLFARHVPTYEGSGAAPLVVGGPSSLTPVLEGWSRLYGRWVTEPGWDFRPLAPGRHRLGALQVETAAAEHLGMEALALRLTLPGCAPLCYTGDTEASPRVTALARGAELLLCECACPDEAPAAGHLTPAAAGRLARDAGATRLVLTHFYPETLASDPAAGAAAFFSGPVTVARDLDTFTF